MYRRSLVPILLLLTWLASTGAATVIVEYHSTDFPVNTRTLTPGLWITTPTGGPWNNIYVNWFNGSLPEAPGTLFLLNQSFAGTPSDLGLSTPGYIADTPGNTSGSYVFNPTVQLQPSSQYYFYTKADPFLLTGGFTVGQVTALKGSYGASGQDQPFIMQGFNADFVVGSGSGQEEVDTTPEPLNFALIGTGLLMVGALRLRARR